MSSGTFYSRSNPQTPANAVVAREERRAAQKRKKEQQTPGVPPPRKQPRPAAPPSAPKKTGVFVTNLPPTTTISQLEQVFSKAGVLLVGDDGEPRIKLYHDEEGKFKGEALVIYFKEGSVDLAVTLLDETELELGAGMGVMRVKEAVYEAGSKGGNDALGSTAKGNGEKSVKEAGPSASASGEPAPVKKKEYSAEEKAKMSKRIRAMQE